MKKTLISGLIVCSLLFINFDPVAATDKIIKDSEDDVIDLFSVEYKFVSDSENIDITEITYSKQSKTVTLTLQVKGEIENRGHINNPESAKETDIVAYSLNLVTSKESYEVYYANDECQLYYSHSDEPKTILDYSVDKNILTVSFELKNTDETYNSIHGIAMYRKLPDLSKIENIDNISNSEFLIDYAPEKFEDWNTDYKNDVCIGDNNQDDSSQNIAADDISTDMSGVSSNLEMSSGSSQSINTFENNKTTKITRTIKIGLLLQKYDWMDTGVKLILLPIYKKCLYEGEQKYNVDFDLIILEDGINSGDVHSGILENSDFDVVLGPGGFGSWYTSETYREKIRNFVANGGGYYGICGDSTFGGFKPEISEEYEKLINKLFNIRSITDMLGIANVHSNMTIFEEMIGDPDDFTMIKMCRLLIRLMTSRAPVKFLYTDPPIQEPFFDSTVSLMLGNVPLIEANKIAMSEVIDIGIFDGYDAPYPSSIVGGTAIIATTYKAGRVVLSAPHAELTIGYSDAHHVFIRNLLWAANALPE